MLWKFFSQVMWALIGILAFATVIGLYQVWRLA